MRYFTYILECKNRYYYTGITWNLKKRVSEHNLGIKTCIQKSRRPVELVYWETFDNIKEAAKREKEIKGWRREKKETLIKNFIK